MRLSKKREKHYCEDCINNEIATYEVECVRHECVNIKCLQPYHCELGYHQVCKEIYGKKWICDKHWRLHTGNIGRDPELYLGDITEDRTQEVDTYIKRGIRYKNMKGNKYG